MLEYDSFSKCFNTQIQQRIYVIKVITAYLNLIGTCKCSRLNMVPSEQTLKIILHRLERCNILYILEEPRHSRDCIRSATIPKKI